MSTAVLILISGLGLGALYFLLSSGLSLIFGLMRVLSFAHGAFMTVSAFAAWIILDRVDSPSTAYLVAAILFATVIGALMALVTELLVIRRLKGRTLEQLLATVGIATALVALLSGIWGPDRHLVDLPSWVTGTTAMFGTNIPNSRLMLIVAAFGVLILIKLLLGRTRYGLVIRAGVENDEMVSALGIDVQRSFTFIFTLGGALAGLGGALAACYYRGVDPHLGDQLLIFSFIVLIIGGLGSVHGAMVAAIVLGVSQSLANYYVAPGFGDILAVLLLIATLIFRPQGLFGTKERLA